MFMSGRSLTSYHFGRSCSRTYSWRAALRIANATSRSHSSSKSRRWYRRTYPGPCYSGRTNASSSSSSYSSNSGRFFGRAILRYKRQNLSLTYRYSGHNSGSQCAPSSYLWPPNSSKVGFEYIVSRLRYYRGQSARVRCYAASRRCGSCAGHPNLPLKFFWSLRRTFSLRRASPNRGRSSRGWSIHPIRWLPFRCQSGAYGSSHPSVRYRRNHGWWPSCASWTYNIAAHSRRRYRSASRPHGRQTPIGPKTRRRQLRSTCGPLCPSCPNGWLSSC